MPEPTPGNARPAPESAPFGSHENGPTLLAALRDLVRRLPGLIADSVDTWVMGVHRPNERTRRPPLAGPYCWACPSKSWPCDHYRDAKLRVEQRRQLMKPP